MNHCGRPTCQCYSARCCSKCYTEHENFPNGCINSDCECHQPDTSVQGERISTPDGGWAPAPDTREWEERFVKRFYVYNLEKDTPAGAEKEAVEFITTLLLAEREKGRDEGMDYFIKDGPRAYSEGVNAERTRTEEAGGKLRAEDGDFVNDHDRITWNAAIDAVLKIIRGD